MRRPWSFTSRIAVALTGSLAVAIAIAALSTLALRTLLANAEHLSVERVTHLGKVERLRRFFSEKLAAQRGHELTGRDFLRVEAEVSRSRFLETLEELREGARETAEAALLEEVERTEAQHQSATDALVLARQGGAVTEQLDEAFLRANALRAQTSAVLDRLQAFTAQRLEEDTQKVHRSERQALGFILLLATLGMLLAMGLAWVLTRALWPLHHEARSTAERFRLLVEGVKDYALFLLDPGGRVATWNVGAERIQGWGADDIIERPGALLYPPEAVAEGVPQRELERALREGRLETVGWRVRRDGSSFWAETLLTPLRDEDGRLQGYAVLTRDITERTRLERAQRLFADAERLFLAERDPDEAVAGLARRLVPEVADGCLLFLASGPGPDEVEPRAVAHVSAEKERIIWDIIGHDAHTREWPHGARYMLRTGRTELVTEVTPELLAQSADDAEHLALFRRLGVCSYLSVPLRAGSRSLGVLILLSHRPELRFTEVDRVFIEELAGRAALSLDNARLLREAQAALELIGVAAHDLGNPLNALQLMLGKLRRSPPAEPERLRESLAQAGRYTQRLGRLLHNLLDLSRLSSGNLELEVGEVDLGELAHDAVARHAEQAAEAGSRLVLKVDLGVVGRWDRLRLERVMTNLLSNAFKYGKGQPIEVHVEQGEGRARLVVRDHGPGIPLEAQHRIFERFKKAPSEGPKKEGFGLGLYIVRQLVEAHGGTVRVDSEPGEGAAFTVELPLVPVRREVDAGVSPPGLLH